MEKYTFAKALAFIFYKNKSKFDGWQNIQTEFKQGVDEFVSGFALFRARADMFLNEQMAKNLPKNEDEINELFRTVCELKLVCSEYAIKYCDLENYFLSFYKSEYDKLEQKDSTIMQTFLKEYFSYSILLSYYQVLHSIEARVDKLKGKIEKQKFKNAEKQPTVN